MPVFRFRRVPLGHLLRTIITTIHTIKKEKDKKKKKINILILKHSLVIYTYIHIRIQ